LAANIDGSSDNSEFIPLKGFSNLASAQLKLLDFVILPLLCAPIFLAATSQDPYLRGFVQRLDTLLVCIFVYAPAFAIYIDSRFKLVSEIPRCLLAGTAGALAGFFLAITISIWPTRSPSILERFSFEWGTLLQWVIPLVVYGASTAALAILIIHCCSNFRAKAG